MLQKYAWHGVCTLTWGSGEVATHDTSLLCSHHDMPAPNLGLPGEGIMKLLDSLIRAFVLAQATGLRWLREEFAALQVRIPLTEGCLAEFVREADEAARREGSDTGRSYVQQLRGKLALQASFIQRWTGSDEPIAPTGEQSLQALVRIAHKHALPRRWKLSEPVVVEYRRTQPSYWTWTTEVDPGPVPQA